MRKFFLLLMFVLAGHALYSQTQEQAEQIRSRERELWQEAATACRIPYSVPQKVQEDANWAYSMVQMNQCRQPWSRVMQGWFVADIDNRMEYLNIYLGSRSDEDLRGRVSSEAYTAYFEWKKFMLKVRSLVMGGA